MSDGMNDGGIRERIQHKLEVCGLTLDVVELVDGWGSSFEVTSRGPWITCCASSLENLRQIVHLDIEHSQHIVDYLRKQRNRE